jgi:hypothetical protein
VRQKSPKKKHTDTPSAQNMSNIWKRKGQARTNGCLEIDIHFAIDATKIVMITSGRCTTWMAQKGFMEVDPKI